MPNTNISPTAGALGLTAATPPLTAGLMVRSSPSLKGDVAFTISRVHAIVTNYQIRIRAAGDSNVVQTVDLGRPGPRKNNTIVANIATVLNALGAGAYETTVAVTSPLGTVDSAVSNAFTVPLV